MRVPFKGGGDAVNSMLTGTTQIAIFGIGNLIQLIRDGKIIGLAVDGDKRSPLAPDIPTFKEAGYTEHRRPDILRHLCADRHAEADRSTNSRPAIAKVASNPEFQKRHMNSRALDRRAQHAGASSPSSWSRSASKALDAIKASGLYPQREVTRCGEGDHENLAILLLAAT